jgi:hypothetical protein
LIRHEEDRYEVILAMDPMKRIDMKSRIRKKQKKGEK